MVALTSTTKAHLEISDKEEISPSLIEKVNEACDQTGEGAFLIRLTGTENNTPDDVTPAVPSGLGVHIVSRWERAVRRLERLPRLTIAAVTGLCHGPAFDVLMATDYRIADTHVTIRTRPATDVSWPGMAIFRMAHQLGVARARQLALITHELSAHQAASIGLINEVVDPIDEATRVACDTFSTIRGKDIAIQRQLIFDAMTTTFEDALGAHLAACDHTMRRLSGQSGQSSISLCDDPS